MQERRIKLCGIHLKNQKNIKFEEDKDREDTLIVNI